MFCSNHKGCRLRSFTIEELHVFQLFICNIRWNSRYKTHDIDTPLRPYVNVLIEGTRFVTPDDSILDMVFPNIFVIAAPPLRIMGSCSF